METVKITSNIAENILKSSLTKAETHLRIIEADIVEISKALQNCMYDKVVAAATVEELKSAISKCQKQ